MVRSDPATHPSNCTFLFDLDRFIEAGNDAPSRREFHRHSGPAPTQPPPDALPQLSASSCRLCEEHGENRDDETETVEQDPTISVAILWHFFFFATSRVARLTLQTRKLWLVGGCRDRPSRALPLTCTEFFKKIEKIKKFKKIKTDKKESSTECPPSLSRKLGKTMHHGSVPRKH